MIQPRARREDKVMTVLGFFVFIITLAIALAIKQSSENTDYMSLWEMQWRQRSSRRKEKRDQIE